METRKERIEYSKIRTFDVVAVLSIAEEHCDNVKEERENRKLK